MKPSDDETIPAALAGSAVILPGHFHFDLGQPDPRRTTQGPSNSLHTSTLGRPGGPLDATSNKGRRTFHEPEEMDLDLNLAGFGIPERNDDQIRLDATDQDREDAIDDPTLGWSSFERLYGLTRGTPLTAASTMAFRRKGRMDPISRPLYDCGTVKVDASGFWMLTSDGRRITQWLNSDSNYTNCRPKGFERIKTDGASGACALGRTQVGNTPIV